MLDRKADLERLISFEGEFCTLFGLNFRMVGTRMRTGMVKDDIKEFAGACKCELHAVKNFLNYCLYGKFDGECYFPKNYSVDVSPAVGSFFSLCLTSLIKKTSSECACYGSFEDDEENEENVCDYPDNEDLEVVMDIVNGNHHNFYCDNTVRISKAVSSTIKGTFRITRDSEEYVCSVVAGEKCVLILSGDHEDAYEKGPHLILCNGFIPKGYSKRYIDDAVVLSIQNGVSDPEKMTCDQTFKISPSVRAICNGKIILTRDRTSFDHILMSGQKAITIVRGMEGAWTNGEVYVLTNIHMYGRFKYVEPTHSFIDYLDINNRYYCSNSNELMYMERFRRMGLDVFYSTKAFECDTCFIGLTVNPLLERIVDLKDGSCYKKRIVDFNTFKDRKIYVKKGDIIRFPTPTMYVDGMGMFMQYLYIRETCYAFYKMEKYYIMVNKKRKKEESMDTYFPEYVFSSIS